MQVAGTDFDVRRTAERVVVAVVVGRVLVQPVEPGVPLSWLTSWTHNFGAPAMINAGNQTTLDRNGIESQSSIADTKTTLAWRQGRLVFNREPLREVIEDVIRYSNTPIVLGDGRIGDVLITGTVSSADIDGWVESLRLALRIRAEHQADRIVLMKVAHTE